MGYADCATGPGGSERGKPPLPSPPPAKNEGHQQAPALPLPTILYPCLCTRNIVLNTLSPHPGIDERASVLASGYYRHPLNGQRRPEHNVYYQTLRAGIARSYATAGARVLKPATVDDSKGAL